MKCGQLNKRSITIPNCQESNDSDCIRTYFLYLPTIVCRSGQRRRQLASASGPDEDKDEDKGEGGDEEGSVLLTNVIEDVGTLPLMFAVHCLGCPTKKMAPFIPDAEARNFVLVLPEGLQRSFNAKNCCGYALDSSIDDVGFFSAVQSELDAEFDFVRPSEASYAAGWSNGGYMVMHAAKLFRAISPISGHTYDVADWMGGDGAGEGVAGKGLFLHHGADDGFVRPTGCCRDESKPKCCCGISKMEDTCTSVSQVADSWATEVNSCDAADNSSSTTEMRVSFEDAERGIECRTAAATSCHANVTVCMHKNGGHFNKNGFGESFTMISDVVDFFARDACAIHDGDWDGGTKSCTCREQKARLFRRLDSGGRGFETEYRGVYCLDAVGAESTPTETVGNTTNLKALDTEKMVNDYLSNNAEAEPKKSGGTAAIVSLLVLSAFAFCVAPFFWKKKNSYHHKRVSFRGLDEQIELALQEEENQGLISTNTGRKHRSDQTDPE